MKNHLGQYECKLCLTLHMNEGNYLAHTQGKRHQYNLGRRAVSYSCTPCGLHHRSLSFSRHQAQEARDREVLPQPVKQKVSIRKSIKIGRPGYRVTKQRDPETNQRCPLSACLSCPIFLVAVVRSHLRSRECGSGADMSGGIESR